MAVIEVSRVYEEIAAGRRILVDRLWPRGKRKEDLELTDWAKAVAPSTELRRTFAHDPETFPRFREAYLEELNANPAAADFLEQMAIYLADGPVVFLYAAKSREYNHALVLRDWVLSRLDEAAGAEPAGTKPAGMKPARMNPPAS